MEAESPPMLPEPAGCLQDLTHYSNHCSFTWIPKATVDGCGRFFIFIGHEICQNTFCLSLTMRIYNCLSVIFLGTVFWRRATTCPESRTSLFTLKMIANKGQESFKIPLLVCSDRQSYWNKTFKVLPFTVLSGRYFTDKHRHSEMLPGLKSFIYSFRRTKGMAYGNEKPAVGRHG